MKLNQSLTGFLVVFTLVLVFMGWESNTSFLNLWTLTLAGWALYVSWKRPDCKKDSTCCQSDNGSRSNVRPTPDFDWNAVQKRKVGRPKKQK